MQDYIVKINIPPPYDLTTPEPEEHAIEAENACEALEMVLTHETKLKGVFIAHVVPVHGGYKLTFMGSI